LANTAPANRKTFGKITFNNAFSGRNNVKHHTMSPGGRRKRREAAESNRQWGEK
jgi:hypothetical protein